MFGTDLSIFTKNQKVLVAYAMDDVGIEAIANLINFNQSKAVNNEIKPSKSQFDTPKI